MPTHLLTRRRHRPRPALSLTEGVALEHGRAHEACGPARHSFALWLAAAARTAAPDPLPAPVLWLSPPQAGKQLNPEGMAPFASPARFLFVQAARTEDLLWTMEEALRSGTAPLVVAELPVPPAMTPVRRLHLAAEAGGRFGPAPLGLLLTPGAGGAQGIESRWHLSHAPCPSSSSPPGSSLSGHASAGSKCCWTLQRLRARTLPPRSWQITQACAGSPLQAAPLPPGTASQQTARPAAAGGLPHPQAALAAPAPP